MYTIELPDNLQKLVDLGESGTDILHGELKRLIYDAEQELARAQEVEDETEEAMDSMERKYWEGQLDGLSHVYALTYQLAFAIDERIKANEARG
jgi:hypothetical protein